MHVEVGFACGDCTHANGATARDEVDLWRAKKSREGRHFSSFACENWAATPPLNFQPHKGRMLMRSEM